MKVALLGDTALFGKFSVKEGDPFKHLKATAELLKNFDLVVLNLETPFADEKAREFGNKSAYIKSTPSNIELLKFLNIKAVNLANNHIFDYGRKSYSLTKALLMENNIDYFGTEDKQFRVEIDGNKVAFTGYCCYSTNPIGAGDNGVNILNFQNVKKKITENLLQSYNNIVSIHAGEEHVNYPNMDHIVLARKLSNDLPFVLYGHHPHVLQGIEKYNNSIHFYSLGNFCFDDVYTKKSKFPLVEMTENNKASIVAVLNYEHNKLINHWCLPLYDASPCSHELSQDILNRMELYSDKLHLPSPIYTKTRNEIINHYRKNRKKRRNIAWYYKRLNYNTLRMILNSKCNMKKYKLNVLRYLNEANS